MTKRKIAQVIAIMGTHTIFINVQNGVQPCALKPVQSSDEARNPIGIDATSNRAIKVGRHASTFFAGQYKLANTTQREAPTRSQNDIESKAGISALKSIAKRMSSKADTNRPIVRSNR
ncbi:MAG TPA: hypothetical protein VNN73_10040 [Blastocatellia bacterium]|nr:hypothetical protein [Blastocatellia bacterium]